MNKNRIQVIALAFLVSVIGYSWFATAKYRPILGWIPFSSFGSFTSAAMKITNIQKQPAQTDLKSDSTPSPTDSKPRAEARLPEVEDLPSMPPAETDAMRDIQVRFNTGDYGTTLQLADKYSNDDSLNAAFKAWLQKQMPVILLSAGWSQLKLGKCDEAIKIFRRGESLKRTSETAKGLAYCYFKTALFDAAEDQFDFYLKSAPHDLQMKLFQAENLESLGNYRSATEILENALAQIEGAAGTHNTQETAAPREKSAFDTPEPSSDPKESTTKQKEDIRRRLSSMREKEKEGHFQIVTASNNFALTYRATEHEEVASFSLDTLESSLGEYVEQFGFSLPGTPIEVILYPAGKTFRKVIGEGPDWMVGLFDGRIRIPVEDEKGTEDSKSLVRRILRHELSHALLSKNSDARTFPPWFEEGLAQRVECGSSCSPFQATAKPGAFLTSSEFETPFTAFEKVKADRAYKQSLFLFMTLETYYGKDSIKRLVSSISQSGDVSSDGLLRPLDTTFAELLLRGSAGWKRLGKAGSE